MTKAPFFKSAPRACFICQNSWRASTTLTAKVGNKISRLAYRTANIVLAFRDPLTLLSHKSHNPQARTQVPRCFCLCFSLWMRPGHVNRRFHPARRPRNSDKSLKWIQLERSSKSEKYKEVTWMEINSLRVRLKSARSHPTMQIFWC